MTFVHVFQRDLPEIETALAKEGVTGVVIAPPFLGRAVVQCPDEAAAGVVTDAVERRTAA